MRGPLLEQLDKLEEKCLGGDLSLREIFDIFGNEGHHVLILFMTLPLLQPVPLFVLSTPFGILMAIASVCYFKKLPPWLPKKWEQKKVSAKIISVIAEGAEKIFVRLHRLIHRRWQTFFQGPFEYINLVLTFTMAIILALPLPIPFSNAIPAWMIFFQAIGHLERDGLFIALSYIQSVICLVFFYLIYAGISVGWSLFNSAAV